MNERIKLLAEQSGFNFRVDCACDDEIIRIYKNADKVEKLAELIVRECAQYMYEHYPHSRYEINYMRKHMGDADWNKPIKEHFGVE